MCATDHSAASHPHHRFSYEADRVRHQPASALAAPATPPSWISPIGLLTDHAYVGAGAGCPPLALRKWTPAGPLPWPAFAPTAPLHAHTQLGAVFFALTITISAQTRALHLKSASVHPATSKTASLAALRHSKMPRPLPARLNGGRAGCRQQDWHTQGGKTRTDGWRCS